MIVQADIPEPINFNPLKHHLGYILYFLEKASKEELQGMIASLNHNNVDLYSGDLSYPEICQSFIDMAENEGFYSRDDFEKWIRARREYRKIRLEDDSVWIVRPGEQYERYIHIHPAKYGPLSIRYKGSTLKTIYQLKRKNYSFSGIPAVEMVNEARIEIGLSPVKRLIPGKGILKCWDSFNVNH